MLKKYLQFIKEDISAIEDKHHSLLGGSFTFELSQQSYL